MWQSAYLTDWVCLVVLFGNLTLGCSCDRELWESNWHSLGSPGKRVSVRECPHQVSGWVCLWWPVFIAIWCRKAGPIVGSTITWTGALDHVGQQKPCEKRHVAWGIDFFLLLIMDVTWPATCTLPWLPLHEGLWAQTQSFLMLLLVRVLYLSRRNEPRRQLLKAQTHDVLEGGIDWCSGFCRAYRIHRKEWTVPANTSLVAVKLRL